jgi:hypothetical protein
MGNHTDVVFCSQVALEIVCNSLESEQRETVAEAKAGLEGLRRKVNTHNLERVRRVKTKLTRLTGRVAKVRLFLFPCDESFGDGGGDNQNQSRSHIPGDDESAPAGSWVDDMGNQTDVPCVLCTGAGRT